MPLIQYETRNFRKQSSLLIDVANSIIAEYQEAGYELTLRQLYYQFVARDIIKNSEPEYKKLGDLVGNARKAGLVDWGAIVDRTRPTRCNSHFDGPGDILLEAAEQYRIDTRATQNIYLEVWVEKEALLGVIEPVCTELDVPYMACKGYLSLSAMWRAAQRMIEIERSGRKSTVVYLGDHDPSGIDMSRNIQDQLEYFGSGADVERIALNLDQIEKYNPPANPAKLTDKRSKAYVTEYGPESWELDALAPAVIDGLIRNAVAEHTDERKRRELMELEESHKKSLARIADNWETF